MDTKKILKDIEEILKEKVGADLKNTLTEETNFLKGGMELDSVMLLELIVELELKYDIEIDEDELTTEHFEKAIVFAEFIKEKIDQK